MAIAKAFRANRAIPFFVGIAQLADRVYTPLMAPMPYLARYVRFTERMMHYSSRFSAHLGSGFRWHVVWPSMMDRTGMNGDSLCELSSTRT